MRVMPAYLGWKNPADDGRNVRLYACDLQKPTSPRWAGAAGRTVETAIVERDGGNREGDRYLVVHVGDRFVDDAQLEALTLRVEQVLQEVFPEG